MRLIDARIIEVFPITMKTGKALQGFLCDTRFRTAGRRIIVRNDDGIKLYDTDDCHDLANAMNGLDLWLVAEETRRAGLIVPPTLAEALADPQGFVEGMTPLGRTTAEVLADRAAFQEAMGVDDPLPNRHDER